MEDYAQNKDTDYNKERYAYELMGEDNEEASTEHDFHDIYNVGIDDDSHVDNISVFVNRQENSQQRFSLYQTQGRGDW